MIRYPASFQFIFDTIALLGREKLVPREHEVAEIWCIGLFGLTELADDPVEQAA